MIYMATSINESPVITDKAGVAIPDVRGKAVKFDENGGIVLCAAGEVALGVGIMANDVDIEVGRDVNIQVKDIGRVYAGAAVKKGDELSADANGAFVKASGADYVAAIALEAAADAGVYIQARLVGYQKTV